MIAARALAAIFVVISVVISSRPNDYFLYLLFPALLLVGFIAWGVAIADRPADRLALRMLVFGLILPTAPALFTIALTGIGIDLESARSISTAMQVADVTLRTVIVWVPLAIIVAAHFRRKIGLRLTEPLPRTLLGLRLCACVMLPASCVILRTESDAGGVGISVFVPLLVVAWSAARLAWTSEGEDRQSLIRFYLSSFAIVGATTLAFIAAQLMGTFDENRSSASSYFRNPNWRLLSLSQLGVPLALLALFYVRMSSMLFRERRQGMRAAKDPQAATTDP